MRPLFLVRENVCARLLELLLGAVVGLSDSLASRHAVVVALRLSTLNFGVVLDIGIVVAEGVVATHFLRGVSGEVLP